MNDGDRHLKEGEEGADGGRTGADLHDQDRHLEERAEEKDDGRTVADMNVDGMPWRSPRGYDPLYLTTMRHRRFRGEYGPLRHDLPPLELSKAEIRQLTTSALLGALLIGAVFVAGLLLFILFSIHVWLA